MRNLDDLISNIIIASVVIIIIIPFVLGSLTYAKHYGYEECKDTQVVVSGELDPYFNTLVDDYKTNGVNHSHIYCLSDIKTGFLAICNGITDLNTGCIRLSKDLLYNKDSIGTRFVLYHEVGHWYGLEHSDGIMKESYNSTTDSKWAENNWEDLKQDYFNKLKDL